VAEHRRPLPRDAGTLRRVRFALSVFSLSFQESPKSAKSTTKPGGSGGSGKDGGAENSEEVRLSPWVRQRACAARLRGGKRLSL